MEYFKVTRELLGQSQNEFAGLIGCNEGQLALAGSWRQNLPRGCAKFSPEINCCHGSSTPTMAYGEHEPWHPATETAASVMHCIGRIE